MVSARESLFHASSSLYACQSLVAGVATMELGSFNQEWRACSGLIGSISSCVRTDLLEAHLCFIQRQALCLHQARSVTFLVSEHGHCCTPSVCDTIENIWLTKE